MSKKAVKWGVLGAMAGAVAGLLFAPKSGKETRDDIKQGAVKAKDEAGKKYGEAKAEVSKQTKRAQTTAKTYANKTSRAAKSATSAAKKEFNR